MPSIVQINVDANNGSNGAIARNIGKLVAARGWKSYIAYGRKSIYSEESTLIRIGSSINVYLHAIYSRIFDKHGLASKFATKRFIKKLQIIQPDIVHLHNIHGYYINYKILFNYLIKKDIPLVWTLHDCWSMTGHCAHFVTAGCDKWRSECNHCPLLSEYPKSIFIDNSRNNYLLKKRLFASPHKVEIVAVSEWVANYARESFLGKHHITVINNGVDLNIFKPCFDIHFRETIAPLSKKILLGVSVSWTKLKGINEFIELSKDDRFQVVMVGVDDSLKTILPSNILTISKTESQEELAKYYSNADVLVNPTYADTFPTVNLESLACGTPIVTYKTGGSPEAVSEDTGIVVECGDKARLKYAIEEIVFSNRDYRQACRCRAEKLYNKEDRYQDYIKIYEQLLK